MKFERINSAPNFLRPVQKNSPNNTSQEIKKAAKRSNGIVISVSHDDYTRVVGGIQNIIGAEHLEFNKRGITYIHLCPELALRGLSKITKSADFKFSIRLDGRPLLSINGQELQNTLKQLQAQSKTPLWVFHHLMGHSPEVLQELLSHGTKKPLLWIHDYFAACSSFTLMRNDAAYCDAPPPQSTTCSSCKYGSNRQEHITRMRRFIEQTQPIITAPSQFALKQWSKVTGISPVDSVVIPPVRLTLEPVSRPEPSRTLRIAYIGRQDKHKGWDIYYQLAEAFRRDNRYKFFQFGKAPKGIFRQFNTTVRNVSVAVSARNRDAMVEALTRHKIDAVVCWSLWPETFNITVHEAMASGAFIIARRQQGNVWPVVSHHAPLASRALDSEGDLHAYFQAGQLHTDLLKSPCYRGKTIPSTGSVEVLT
ncbi:glycosyltransferase family protein [Azohydromonas lata]|uniref:Glycosyltransferase n=1 Tax=Azohydromonas lata TaxID=45677 RepID=A0ABU5IJM1_9BURK|nr:hypothetical protein [Azohydromonas lata]MDZ5459074.1 hypothetical protein [Azohydromonas lata]